MGRVGSEHRLKGGSRCFLWVLIMPKISICIPTYNRDSYVIQTLKSVFDQQISDFEVIVVDDGSTDNTEQVIKDSGFNVRYYRQENAGDAAARNTAIGLANGDYIAFMDSDDLYTENAIAEMLDVIKNAGEDVVAYGGYIGIDSQGSITKYSKKKLYSGRVTEHLFQEIFIHTVGSLIPVHILKEFGNFNSSFKVCSDYDFWLNVSKKYKFIAIENPSFYRRRHSDNLSTISSENLKVELSVLEKFYFKDGGQDYVSKEVALSRLARECCRIANTLKGESNKSEARFYYKKSLDYQFSVKALLRKLICY